MWQDPLKLIAMDVQEWTTDSIIRLGCWLEGLFLWQTAHIVGYSLGHLQIISARYTIDFTKLKCFCLLIRPVLSWYDIYNLFRNTLLSGIKYFSNVTIPSLTRKFLKLVNNISWNSTSIDCIIFQFRNYYGILNNCS